RLGAHAVTVSLLQQHDRRVATCGRSGWSGGRCSGSSNRRGGSRGRCGRSGGRVDSLPPHHRCARKGEGKNHKNLKPESVPHFLLAVFTPPASAAVAQNTSLVKLTPVMGST